MTDADVRGIGEALLARSAPRADWTHEAHLPARAAGLVAAILFTRTALFGGSAVGVYDG